MKSLMTLLMVCIVTGGAFAQHDMQKKEGGSLKAVAIVYPAKGKTVHGTVTFTQTEKGVKVVAHLEGLMPGKHGFHVHEFGDCTAPDYTSAGAHFNPTLSSHGGPASEQRHSGDLGNLIADEKGVAKMEWLDPMMQMTGPASILGRSVIVHTNEDDIKSQPTGNAGGREGCGVIGIAK